MGDGISAGFAPGAGGLSPIFPAGEKAPPGARAEASAAAAAALFASFLVPLPPNPVPAAAAHPESALKTRAPKVEKEQEGVEAGAAPAGLDGFVAAAAQDAAVAVWDGAVAIEPRSAAAEPPPDSAAERVAVADPLGIERIESSRLAGDDALRIDLAPDGLGALSLRLAIRNGEVTATLLATREAAAGLLLPEIEAARAALAARGVSVGAFVVAFPRGAAAGGGGAGAPSEDEGDPNGAGGRVAPVDGRKSRRRRARFDFTV